MAKEVEVINKATTNREEVMVEFKGGQHVYRCCACQTVLALKDSLVSKAFNGAVGKGWLVNQVVNINFAPAQDKQLATGLHRISEINCKWCKQYVGWHYITAFEESQKYKESKFILERSLITLNIS